MTPMDMDHLVAIAIQWTVFAFVHELLGCPLDKLGHYLRDLIWKK